MISSNKIARLRQIDYIPVTQFQGIGTDGTSVLDSMGNGDPLFQQVNSLGLTGCLMASAGDDIQHFMRIPTKWDRDNNIYIRFVWQTGSDDTADSITWKFLYGLFTPGVDALVAPATALDTALVSQDMLGTVQTLERTATAGVLLGGTIPDADLYMAFLCEMDAFDAGLTQDKLFLGVEFEYTTKMGRGNRVGEPDAWEA